jgi:WD domain, G-beta repeat
MQATVDGSFASFFSNAMNERAISASLSEQALTFRGDPVSILLTVVNESDQFASFQVELLAAGAEDVNDWYRLAPEVGAKKPAGARTDFQITIIASPVLGFKGDMNVAVRIYSPELREERKYIVRLSIDQHNGPAILAVELPAPYLQVYPSNVVEIPVRVRNLSQQTIDAILRLDGIDAAWLDNRAERRHLVKPGSEIETTFTCKPPKVSEAPSQEYPFTVTAEASGARSNQAKGRLEVMPVGFVKFACAERHKTLPPKDSWRPNTSRAPACFRLEFENISNIAQSVSIDVEANKKIDWTFPDTLVLPPGLLQCADLSVFAKRPWLGLNRLRRLVVKARLGDQRLGSPEPNSQNLELLVLPVIPVWLQALVLLLAIALVVWLSYQRYEEPHTDNVNTVHFSSDALYVLSGSDDRTVRRWTIEKGFLFYTGKLGTFDKAVRVLRFVPGKEEEVAVGLENGKIELWNVPTGRLEGTFGYQQGDRVFGLAFTNNSHHLFSGHGSGLVLAWNPDHPNSPPERVLRLAHALDYTVQTLALSRDERTLVSAGRFNRFILWDLAHPNNRPRRVLLPGGTNDYIWSADFADRLDNLLVTADSHGYITLWDLANCRSAPPTSSTQPIDVNCPQYDRWQGHGGLAVRSVALNDNGRMVISGGDDGRVMLWPLNAEFKRDQNMLNGREIQHHKGKVNSVDLIEDRQGLLVLSGGDDRRVILHRLGGSDAR